MKFSITFKYQNVTLKNKETKETVTYDTKAEGNSFAFDNVDEDVVIGIVKGIKNKKAADVFAFDNLRTNFINVLARNKCKELYDKLDKGEWKIEDVAVSNITIKDVEFTKPTMNARETITVESAQKPSMASESFDTGEMDVVFRKDRYGVVVAFFPETMRRDGGKYGSVLSFDIYKLKETRSMDYYYNCSPCPEDERQECLDKMKEEFPGVKFNIKEKMFDESARRLNTTKEHFEKSEYYTRKYGKLKFMSESGDKFKTDKGNVVMFKEDAIALRKMRERVSENKHNDTMEVIFKKDRESGDVVAFFPETMWDRSCNPGMIMSYEHAGQHGEASLEYFHECRPCPEEEYADLLHELEVIYDDVQLVVKSEVSPPKPKPLVDFGI